MPAIVTNIATSTPEKITIRGKDLVNELVGKYSFTEILYFLITDRFPTASQCRVLDACLVVLMEHGLTPSALITRLVSESVPGEVQVAMASGLMAIGSVFAGTMEGCAAILHAGGDLPDADAYCRQVVAAHRAEHKPVPGFGHHFHKPDDPRTPRLLAVAAEAGLAGRYVPLLRRLSVAVDESAGRHLTINATGAIAALLLEIGIPAEICRAIAVVSRSGGLVGHVMEERRTKSARTIAKAAVEKISYEDPAHC
jgi:citrate synthase